MFVSDRVLSAFPVPYIRIVNPWKVIRLHARNGKALATVVDSSSCDRMAYFI
jgi:hypothetical protein